MTPRRQLYDHKPEIGRYGDCHRTCFAMILDMNPADIPNFGDHHKYPDHRQAERDFLAEHNLSITLCPFDCDLDTLLSMSKNFWPGTPCIITGRANERSNHSVVVLNGAIHNPAFPPIDLVGPCIMEGDGLSYFAVRFITVGKKWEARTAPAYQMTGHHLHHDGHCGDINCIKCMENHS